MYVDIPAGTTRTRNEQNVDGSAGLEYQFTPRKMVYVYWSKGSKSGGFQSFPANTVGIVATPTCHGDILCAAEYGPEETTTIEAGTKLRFAHDVYIAFAAFDEDVTGFQYTQTQTFPFPTVIANLDLRSQGIDLTGTWRPFDELTLALGVNYAKVVNIHPGPATNPEFAAGTIFSATQPRDPYWTANFNADWTHPIREHLDVSADLQVDYKSSSYLQPPLAQETAVPPPGPAFPLYVAGTKVDLALSLKSDAGWQVSLIGKNLTNFRPISFATSAPPFLPEGAFGTIDPPRTVALQVSFFH
jgi:outer membrane receptor protein involved in Fe transport